MPVPTPSNVVKISIRHGLNLDVKMTTHLFWSYTGSAPTPANCATLAAAIGNAWNANLASLCSTAGVMEEVDVTDLASATGAQGASLTTHAGSRAGLNVSNGACLVTKYTIARHYRGGKPKGFWPFGIASDLTNGNQWLGAFTAAANTAFAAFATAVNGLVAGATTLGTQQNVSYFSGTQANPSTSKWARRNRPAPRAVPLVESVTGIVCSSTLGSQRRRIRQ